MDTLDQLNPNATSPVTTFSTLSPSYPQPLQLSEYAPSHYHLQRPFTLLPPIFIIHSYPVTLCKDKGQREPLFHIHWRDQGRGERET